MLKESPLTALAFSGDIIVMYIYKAILSQTFIIYVPKYTLLPVHYVTYVYYVDKCNKMT